MCVFDANRDNQQLCEEKREEIMRRNEKNRKRDSNQIEKIKENEKFMRHEQ